MTPMAIASVLSSFNEAKIVLYPWKSCSGVIASNERQMGQTAIQIRWRFVWAVFAQTLIVMSAPDALAGEARKSIYEDVPSLVVRLDRYVQHANPGAPSGEVCNQPVGTAFFINSTKKPGNLYLVTARHVIDADNELVARVPLLIEKTAERKIFGMRLNKSDWLTHPNVGSDNILPVDVAMVGLAKLSGVRGRGSSLLLAFYSANSVLLGFSFLHGLGKARPSHHGLIETLAGMASLLFFGTSAGSFSDLSRDYTASPCSRPLF